MCPNDATIIITETLEPTTVIISDDCSDVTVVINETIENVTIEVCALGEQGLSAYDLAVANGFEGTLEEWLDYNIPYVGATKDVDLGLHQLKADSLAVSLESTESIDAGEIVWNAIDGTFDMGLIGGVTLQAGQELHIFGKASEVITNGDAVMFAGSQGDHILLKKAVPSEINSNPEYFIGVATQDFTNNQFGYVTTFGKVRTLDTTIYNSAVLYFDSASASSGKLTDTMPVAPNAKIIVAAVLRVHQTQGVLMVRPHTMPKMADLQDLNISNAANNQTLVFSDGLWQNKYTWEYLAINAKTDGAENTITNGYYLNYDLQGVSIYRYITTATDANGYPNEDSFYATNTAGVLTNLIVTRG